MNWLTQLLGNKRRKRLRTFALDDDQTYRQNSDILEGLEFDATLQIRTPLSILNHHGEIFRGPPSQAPKYGTKAQGIWLPKTKSYRELGLDIEEVSGGTHASDIGAVKPIDYLPFLKSFRSIVESDHSIQDQLKKIKQLSVHSSEYSRIMECLEKSYPDFPHSYFYMQLTGIAGIGKKAARNLYAAGFCTQKQVSSASSAELLKVPGIGAGCIKRIKGETQHL